MSEAGITRRGFLGTLAGLSAGAVIARGATTDRPVSTFCRGLQPIGRILDLPGWYVWCNSPIEDDAGRTHVFFSRWRKELGMGGWLRGCEIAHAVASRPEGPYEVTGPVLQPGPDGWDATTCHNPHIQRIGAQYALFYIGSSNGKTETKRIGLALAPSLAGPWTRADQPLLLPGEAGAWDDHCTTNPALVVRPDGQFALYYKSWRTADYLNDPPPIRGNRKYGVALADQLTGPYRKHPRNPLVDFSGRGENRQCEDAYVWHDAAGYHLIARDMGVYDHEVGLLLHSADGIDWSEPEIAYESARAYVDLPPPPPHLRRYGRLERPQLLFREGRPAYLFTALQGGADETATGFVLKITAS